MAVAVRIASNVVRAVFVINLVLGILFWTDHAQNLTVLHASLGLLLVVSLWLLGVAQALRGGSIGLQVATFVVGLALALLGYFQNGVLVLQILHFLMALAAVGLAESCGARYRRQNAARAA